MVDEPELGPEDILVEKLGLTIHCPHCGKEMVGDGNSLILAESIRGAQFECGSCEQLSQWLFEGDPIRVKQVPFQWGGSF